MNPMDIYTGLLMAGIGIGMMAYGLKWYGAIVILVSFGQATGIINLY